MPLIIPYKVSISVVDIANIGFLEAIIIYKLTKKIAFVRYSSTSELRFTLKINISYLIAKTYIYTDFTYCIDIVEVVDGTENAI